MKIYSNRDKLQRTIKHAALCVFAVTLAGCETYWVKSGSPVDIATVDYVTAPCGNPGLNGCWSPKLRSIQVNVALNEGERQCVIGHEAMHAKGYAHKHGWKLYRTDCGYGMPEDISATIRTVRNDNAGQILPTRVWP